MRTTMTLAANYSCSPFDILNQDIDDVLVILSFYVEMADENDSPVQTKHGVKEKRIRVNDKTATGGWW